MRIADFVSNEIEMVVPGKIPVYRIKEVGAYDFAARGVTEQFLDDASTYYDRYTNPAHFRALYGLAFDRNAITPKAGAHVLDIGTGGGNSVFAVHDLLPGAQILGIDISQPLLEMCAKAANDHHSVTGDSMAMLVADLYDIEPVADSVDFITGSSILHHMLDPEALILHVAKSLRSGGYAIFNEPMEEAHGIFRALLAGILEDDASQLEHISDETAKFFAAYVRDFDARKGIGHVRKNTQWLDDKWFFTRSWFQSVAAKAGCDKIEISQTHGGRDMFWRQFVVASRLFGVPAAPEILPRWARRRFEIMDESLSEQQKRDFTFAAVVVMRKA
jgi:SAM-dependent methyltransferase